MFKYSDKLFVAVFLLFMITEIKCKKKIEDYYNENNTCIVPPADAVKNGRVDNDYDDDEKPPPGARLFSYVVTVTCNPGYKLIGQRFIQCITDRFSEPLPKCVPKCITKSPELLSCGMGYNDEESQCLVTNSNEGIIAKSSTKFQCGMSSAIYRNTVANGTVAKLEDAPWHAGVYKKTTKPYMQICGGTIISANVILSAAHCFWGALEKKLPARNYAVAVGKIYRPWDDPNDDDVQKSDIREIRIPPRFQGSATNFQDDIAALILVTPITFSNIIVPVCLDFNYQFDVEQLAHGTNGRVVGWGLTSADGVASQLLNKAELPVVNIEQCIAQSQPEFLSSITSDKICAGYNNGTSVCRGDSGGGLAFEQYVDNGFRYFLRGIVSTAPTTDHLCNVFAVATFTHVIKHEHFINAALEGTPIATVKVTPPNITIEKAIEQANLNNAIRFSNNTDLTTTIEANDGGSLKPAVISKKGTSINDLDHKTDIVYTPAVFIPFTEYLKKTDPNAMPCFYTLRNLTACQGQRKKILISSNENSNIDTNIRLQVTTGVPDFAPITNSPVTTSSDEIIPNTERPIINKYGDSQDRPEQDVNTEVLKQENVNKKVLIEGEINKGVFNPEKGNKEETNKQRTDQNKDTYRKETNEKVFQEDGLNQAEKYQTTNNQTVIPEINKVVLNREGINKEVDSRGGGNQRLPILGGINQEVQSHEVINQGVLNQGIPNPVGFIQTASNQGLGNNGPPGLGSIDQGVFYQGSTTKNQGIPNQVRLNQGVPNQESPNEGFFPQNGPNQGVLNPGTLYQDVPAQGGINQGFLNNGVPNQGGSNQGVPNQGNINQAGLNQPIPITYTPTIISDIPKQNWMTNYNYQQQYLLQQNNNKQNNNKDHQYNYNDQQNWHNSPNNQQNQQSWQYSHNWHNSHNHQYNWQQNWNSQDQRKPDGHYNQYWQGAHQDIKYGDW